MAYRNKIVEYLILLMITMLAWWVLSGFIFSENTIEKIYYNEMAMVEGNSLIGVSAHYLRYFIEGREVPEKLYRIIKCESGLRAEVCNKEFGCAAGMGYAQIIPKTLAYCESKLSRKLNAFDGGDNIDCALWLFDNYGTRPWGDETTWWGSENCWGK
jgi:hypothetical protein